MSSSLHIDNKGKDSLILGEVSTQRLDDTILTAETKSPINFPQQRKRFLLSLRYNGSNSFLFVNAMNMYQFKVKDSEIKDYALCLGNISTINNMKNAGLTVVVKIFFFDFNPINTSDMLDIHKYLVKRTWYKITFEII